MRARPSAGSSRGPTRNATLLGVVVASALLVPLSITARTVVPRAGESSLLDRIPLAFEPNQGQLDPAVRFVARSPGQNVLLTGTGLTLTPSGVALTLEGARDDPDVEGRDPTAGRVSRFLGDDPTQWTTGVLTFGSVVSRQVYPGVDVVFHGSGRHVEHDFVVAPGIDPATIIFSVGGASARIDGRGNLVMSAAAGDVTLQAPELYQDFDGRRQTVAGAFAPRGDSRFGFTVGAHDLARPLVIDPVLVSASYLGGSSTDTAYGVATDAEGNVVLTGYTESSDFRTVNPAQPTPSPTDGPRTDIFVTKVRSDGSGLLWSTYIGGKGRDAALAVAVGPDGSVVLTGYTESADFPMSRPIKNTNSGGSDVFVLKLNPAGSAVDFSTYIGGSGTDTGNGIVVDQTGAVYVAGTTGSSNFPTANAFQPGISKADDQDAFVLRIEPGLGALTWSSYLGGGGDDHATDVAIDRQGNVYVTGDTKSTNFPVSRAFQPTPGGSGAGVGGSFADAFVVKVKADGTGLVYGTYLGGSDSDKGSGIAVDAEGSVYVTGNTGSANFPAVSAAQPKKDGDFDAFVVKVKADGTGLVYGTYLGGSGSDGAEGIAVDGRGHAYVVGATASTNFPTERPFQSAKGGGFVDAFVTELGASGDSFEASSYLGGRDDDQASGIAVDRAGNFAVVGYTNSADFPIAKPFQPGRGGGVGDAFVTKVGQDGAGDASGPGAGTTERDGRVRTLITLTGLLFLAAILQSVWLRRRPERTPPPRPTGGEPDAPVPGVASPPSRRRRRAPPDVEPEREPPRMPEPEPQPAGAPPLADQVATARLASVGGRPEPRAEEAAVPQVARPRARQAVAAPWRPERPVLRPLERSPAPAEVPRIPTPDLWEPLEAKKAPSPEVVAALPERPSPPPRPSRPPRPATPTRRPAGRPKADRAKPPDEAGAGTLQLDPEDVWGPLNDAQDPGEWADTWGVAALGGVVTIGTEPEAFAPESPPEAAAHPLVEAAPPGAPTVPRPAPTGAGGFGAEFEPEPEAEFDEFTAPEPAPPPPLEPSLEPELALEAELEALTESEAEPPPAPAAASAEPVADPALEAELEALMASEPNEWDVAGFQPPAPSEVEAEPAVSSEVEPEEWDTAAFRPPPDDIQDADPVAPAGALPHELSLDELLDEDLPVPETATFAPEPGRGWLNDLLDEDFPIPEPPPPPAETALAPGPESAELDDEFLPPAPERLLQNLFEPDPDDPLVKATRHRRGRGKDR